MGRYREPRADSARSETLAVGKTFTREPGDLLFDRWRQDSQAARIGKARSRSR